MNRSLTLLMLFCILLLAACKVSQPGDVESSIMKSVKRTVTIGDKDKKNPIASSPDAIKEGGEHFQHHCQICHGLDGHATGVPFAAQMSPPVPDLSDKDIQEYTDGQLHWIVENGIAPSGMPAWKGILDDDGADWFAGAAPPGAPVPVRVTAQILPPPVLPGAP